VVDCTPGSGFFRVESGVTVKKRRGEAPVLLGLTAAYDGEAPGAPATGVPGLPFPSRRSW
jgi:hypothetical protein